MNVQQLNEEHKHEEIMHNCAIITETILYWHFVIIFVPEKK